MTASCYNCVHMETSTDNGRVLHYCRHWRTEWDDGELSDEPCHEWEPDDVEGYNIDPAV